MSKLIWDADSERLYETGVSKGVIYPKSESGTYPKGVAWNGLTNVTESPSGAEATALYADNKKYLNLRSAEEFGGTIEAYMYPPEFGECNGEAQLAKGISVGQQARKPFGFCYQTILGNDTKGEDYGYKIHLVYGAEVSPSDRTYSSVNDSPDAMTLSWEFTTTPINIKGFKPTSLIVINSTEVDPEKLKAFEDILYGKDAADGEEAVEARLPLPDEIAEMFTAG